MDRDHELCTKAEVKNRRCLNLACPLRGKVSSGNIVRHGFYRTRSGKRRRYRCGECGKTFSSTKGTPYYRLQHRRATFDVVIALRVAVQQRLGSYETCPGATRGGQAVLSHPSTFSCASRREPSAS